MSLSSNFIKASPTFKQSIMPPSAHCVKYARVPTLFSDMGSKEVSL
uniref:Uncharacterized protein n=1 Tax=Rhizophora mucronata TaxID=61149 RepID=A0A2P2NWG8_RHIMU